MRDGTKLSTDVYMPNEGGPFPVLFLRTIYNNQVNGIEWVPRFVEAGYAVVLQDCRGRHDSEGEWEPYIHEAEDGYDTHEWIGAQPWCDGNIGMYGSSYIGFTQTQPAMLGSEYLKAIMPSASQQDNFGHWYCDGVFQLHTAISFIRMGGRTMQAGSRGLMNDDELYRRLPLVSMLDETIDIPWARSAVSHPIYDDFWSSYSLRDRYEDTTVPAYFISGWYDNLLHETVRQYVGWKTRSRSDEVRRYTKLIIGPWHHGGLGSADQPGVVDFGAGAAYDIAGEHIRWYDRRLKGIENAIDDEPPVKIFVMGDNVWRSENEWPLSRAVNKKFFMHSQRGANTLHGDGSLSLEKQAGEQPPDRYTYDPMDPTPTLGGSTMGVPGALTGPQDRRPVERREDVVVYTSDPLEADMEVTGPVVVSMWASSSARDTDFAATLVDVYPDGRAVIICEGMLRARFREMRTNYRHAISNPTLMEPGEIYKLLIDMWETSNVFKKGHSIRLEISSSNFPRFDRNLNTGNTPGIDAEWQTADQAIYHDAERQSHLTLPVVAR